MVALRLRSDSKARGMTKMRRTQGESSAHLGHKSGNTLPIYPVLPTGSVRPTMTLVDVCSKIELILSDENGESVSEVTLSRSVKVVHGPDAQINVEKGIRLKTEFPKTKPIFENFSEKVGNSTGNLVNFCVFSNFPPKSIRLTF